MSTSSLLTLISAAHVAGGLLPVTMATLPSNVLAGDLHLRDLEITDPSSHVFVPSRWLQAKLEPVMGADQHWISPSWPGQRLPIAGPRAGHGFGTHAFGTSALPTVLLTPSPVARREQS